LIPIVLQLCPNQFLNPSCIGSQKRNRISKTHMQTNPNPPETVLNWGLASNLWMESN